MKRQLIAVLVVAAAAIASTTASSSSPEPEKHPARLRLATERAVVFKDGYALYVKTATATADASGEVHTFEVPDAAVLGTFWAWTEKGPSLRSMRAELVEANSPTQRACDSTLDVLRANPGRTVTLTLEKTEVTGKLLSLGGSTEPTSRPQPHLSGIGELTRQAGELVALETSRSGRLLLPASSIRTVSGPELTLDCPRPEMRKRLTLDFGKASAGKQVRVRLLYFAFGLRWIPTYRLETAKSPAELALQAELLNDGEPLDSAQVQLVVGVPHFRFKDTPSPLALEQTLRQTLSHAAPSIGYASQQLSNAVFTQRAGERRFDGEDAQLEPPEELTGKAGEELFVYDAGALKLPSGARAILPLWTKEAKARNVYTLDLALQRNGGDAFTLYQGPSHAQSPLQLASAQVWHQLELTNPSKVPWTTGAALVLRNGLPQAQELLTYTLPGGRTLLPVTVAVGVRARHEEKQLEQKANALEINGRWYTRVRKQGTLSISNPRAEALQLETHLKIAGKLETAPGAAIRLHDDESQGALNSRSEATWSVSLKPGEVRTLSYEVSYYR